MGDFQLGDIVYLNSGSPPMTISDFKSEELIECTFFINDHLQKNLLNRNLLTKLNPQKKSKSAVVISKGIEI